jgi:hypothetical protein
MLPGCGVLTDFVHDTELQINLLNNPTFVSPAKLKLGVLPFEDQVGLNNPDVGPKLAILISEEFANNKNLVVVPPEQVRAYVESHNIVWPLTSEESIRICRDLNLNVIVEGFISHVGTGEIRSGWRKLLRWVTSQQRYVETILALKAYSGTNGLVITSRSSDSRTNLGDADDPELEAMDTTTAPAQESIEESVDQTITALYFRALDGLKNVPFTAFVTALDGNNAIINFGTEVNLKEDWIFVVFTYEEEYYHQVTQQTYRIPGAPKAHLKVISVEPGHSVLQVLDGTVEIGDVVQYWVED